MWEKRERLREKKAALILKSASLLRPSPCQIQVPTSSHFFIVRQQCLFLSSQRKSCRLPLLLLQGSIRRDQRKKGSYLHDNHRKQPHLPMSTHVDWSNPLCKSNTPFWAGLKSKRGSAFYIVMQYGITWLVMIVVRTTLGGSMWSF